MIRLTSLSYRFFLAYASAAASIIGTTILLEQLKLNNIANMFIFAFLTALTFGVLHFYFSRIFLRPLDHLIDTSKQLVLDSSSNLRAEKANDDKIGDLVDAFNELVSQLQLREETILSERDRAAIALDQADNYAEETQATNKQLEAEVTERKKIEVQLTEFQDFLKSIIDSMPSALIAIDDTLTVTQWNQEASDISGTSGEDAMGQQIAVAFPLLADHTDWLESIWHTKHSRKRNNIRYVIDERIRYFDIVIYSLHHTTKRSAVVRIDEVTEKRRMEEAIVRSEKVMSLGGMAAGMAHEINNPISAILQNVQNIERRIDINLPANQVQALESQVDLNHLNHYLAERKILDFLHNISDSGVRASNLVKNMLQFSRGGPITLQPCLVTDVLLKAIDIAIADDTLSDIRGNLELNFDQDFQAPEVKVLGVFTELEQVLLNLIKNAAYAIYERKITLNDIDEGIINIKQSIRNHEAIIRVSDNGIGMQENTRRQAFEPFFTTKDVGSGTGLGLSVSYFIINTHHNGKMHVESEFGSGSVFEIALPIYSEE